MHGRKRRKKSEWLAVLTQAAKTMKGSISVATILSYP